MPLPIPSASEFIDLCSSTICSVKVASPAFAFSKSSSFRKSKFALRPWPSIILAKSAATLARAVSIKAEGREIPLDSASLIRSAEVVLPENPHFKPSKSISADFTPTIFIVAQMVSPMVLTSPCNFAFDFVVRVRNSPFSKRLLSRMKSIARRIEGVTAFSIYSPTVLPKVLRLPSAIPNDSTSRTRCFVILSKAGPKPIAS